MDNQKTLKGLKSGEVEVNSINLFVSSILGLSVMAAYRHYLFPNSSYSSGPLLHCS